MIDVLGTEDELNDVELNVVFLGTKLVLLDESVVSIVIMVEFNDLVEG